MNRGKRRELVKKLRGQGVPTEAMARLAGVSRRTIGYDLEQIEQTPPDDPPPRVVLEILKSLILFAQSGYQSIPGPWGRYLTEPQLIRTYQRMYPAAFTSPPEDYELRQHAEGLDLNEVADRYEAWYVEQKSPGGRVGTPDRTRLHD